jgi:hypothetical protein
MQTYIISEKRFHHRARICTAQKSIPSLAGSIPKMFTNSGSDPAIEEKPAQIQTSNRLAISLVRVLTQLPLIQRLKTSHT